MMEREVIEEHNEVMDNDGNHHLCVHASQANPESPLNLEFDIRANVASAPWLLFQLMLYLHEFDTDIVPNAIRSFIERAKTLAEQKKVQ